MARLKERAGLLGLAAFLVVDVLLVAFAISSTREPVAAGGTVVTAPSSAGGRMAGSPKPSSQPGEIEVVPLTVGLVAFDQDTAFRFRTGTCKNGGATLELSGNGGETWGPRAAPYDTITRVRVRPNGSAFAVGAEKGSECTPAIRQTSALDADFGDTVVVQDAWYRDPRAATSVGLPSGGTGKPCGSDSVVDLAVVDTGATALCSDGRMRVSTNGDGWNTSATVEGALAIAVNARGRSFAVVPGVSSCAGLAVVDMSRPDAALGCAELDLTVVVPGTVALGVTSSGGWLLSGGEVFRAGSDLTTWSQP